MQRETVVGVVLQRHARHLQGKFRIAKILVGARRQEIRVVAIHISIGGAELRRFLEILFRGFVVAKGKVRASPDPQSCNRSQRL